MAVPAHEAGRGSWVRVTTALEQVVGPGRPSGSWTKYCCPVHEGDGRHHRPSLSVKYFGDAGRTKVRCQAGCEDELVLDAVGLRVADLYDTPLRRGERGARSGPARRPAKRAESRSDRALRAAGIPAHKPKRDLGAQVSPWRSTATYTYVRADGTVAGEVIRREADFEGGRDKSFSQRSWNSRHGGWERTGFDKIPFQLPQVREAIAAGRTIYLVEGEKDALNAAAAGLVATTNAGGASGWSPEHAEWLRGARTVVIVADRDAPGFHRADRVMATLSGLVGRVRVVQAATGKDLTDHLEAGHRIADLVPIPYLDPYTRALTAVPTPPATTTAAVAGPAPPPSAVSPAPEFPAETPSPQGHPMPESLLTPAAETTPHSDEVDHMHSQWSVFMKLLMQQMLLMATKAVHQRAAAAAEAARKSEQAARDAEERAAAEMAAVEVRLRKLRQKGYDTASRTEIADAVRDAATWGDQSEVAGNELGHLALHVSRRWGVELDLDTGQASIAPGTDAQRLAEIEQDRAAAARARKAQDRMVEMVAREDDLDESAKVGIYAAIESWRADPSAEKLDALTRQLKDRKVPQQTRTRLRFVAAYLGTPAAIGDEENADIKTVSAAEELSRHATPLVDPGEEAKPRIDKLLETYQEQLKVGADTSEVREELAREVAVLTVEDQEAARARGKAIRANPAGAYPRMWPDHVDRDELDEHIRVYALLAPKAEQAAGKAGDLDDVTATQLAKQAASHKTAIRKALTDGKGLHDLERDQIKAVLRDVEAGKPTVPEQLFADDRSAAIVDIQRTQRIAYNTHRTQRRDLDEILDTGAVPEPVRQQVREHLDNTTGAVEMAHRGVADAAFKWARRREAVIVSRTAAVIEADGGYACVHHSVMGTGRERVGAVWCESDYRLLFEALALGMTDEEIAAHIDREVGGVRSRALLLVDNATSKKGALPMLRRLAEAPDFDWDTWVREVHTRENLPYWDTAADEALIGHWAAEPPPRIQQLCEQFGVGQDVIARRAIILGLAQTRAEVVDRFGAAPGSGLAVNAVLAKDKLAAAVAVLVVTDTTGEVLYLSLHPTTDEATTSLQDLTTTPLAAIQGRWTIGTRVVGEGSVRPTDTGTWPATTEYIPAPQERPSRWRRLLRPVRQG